MATKLYVGNLSFQTEEHDRSAGKPALSSLGSRRTRDCSRRRVVEALAVAGGGNTIRCDDPVAVAECLKMSEENR